MSSSISVPKDWLLVHESGPAIAHDITEPMVLEGQPYRLYRFITDVEDLLAQYPDDATRLEHLRPLVRKLLNHCEWLHGACAPPDPELGWSVNMLYDEPDFPLTLQMVTWLPGRTSPIHNHATWGIVAIISGCEQNQFWARTPQPEFPDAIAPTQTLVLHPGDILGFGPDVIHQIESQGDEPTITFNLYGLANYSRRFEFDPTHATATLF